MIDTTLHGVFASQWQVFLIALAVMLVAAEFGFRPGLGLHRTKDEARRGQVGGIQGAVLALLGLLLGFTFAMSANRYESRRELVLQEANAIGTVYLRAALLPEARQTNVESQLRRYVDARLGFYDAGENRAALAAAEQQAARIQRELWANAVVEGKGSPTPVTVMFITALNDMIDLDAARLNALHSNVPGAVWLLVMAVAVSGCWVSGYAAGASGARSVFTNGMLPLLLAVVITLIADIDRPRGGMIGISQQPMSDLKASLQTNLP